MLRSLNVFLAILVTAGTVTILACGTLLTMLLMWLSQKWPALSLASVSGGYLAASVIGLAVPIWSPQYQTFVVITIGLLSAMYDEQRLHDEVAPLMLALGRSLGSLMEGRTVREISRSSVVSEATVRTQVKSILNKLEVSSQLAAVGMANQIGWRQGA